MTLVDVKSSPQLGARCLLAAFACGFCSCALFLLLIGWQARHPHEQGHSSELCARSLKEQCPRSTAVNHVSDRVDKLAAGDQPSGEDAAGTRHGQLSKQSQGIPDLVLVQEHSQTGHSLTGRRGQGRKTSASASFKAAGRPGGSRLLSAVLTLTACGLMAASLWTPVFFLRVTLRRPFETLL